MRADGARAFCIGVHIRTDEFVDKSHQRKLGEATDITTEILDVAERLLRELWDRRVPLRLIGISLTMITREHSEQISLFPDEKKERRRRVDQAVDAIRSRFGGSTIHRATQMDTLSDENAENE
jgi:DNA polymerase-4